MLEENDVFILAAKVAARYCQKYHAWEQFDDAAQEAALWLLKNRDKWRQTESKLEQGVFFALVRWYQNLHGLRRRHKPEVYITGDFWDWGKTETTFLEFSDLIETAIRNAGLEKYCAYLTARAQGATIKQAAKLGKNPNGLKTSQVWDRFSDEIKRLLETS